MVETPVQHLSKHCLAHSTTIVIASCLLGRPGRSVAMAVEMDGPLEHAVLLRQRYAAEKHVGLGQIRNSALITEKTETAW